eukprot:GEMP01030076.1.p1 GENE.GEMP01030076.1~~GEMP01030076.1.p1  ORF type:complete len:246 (+),score=41.46 GEMP01030076.1:241-978(+)
MPWENECVKKEFSISEFRRFLHGETFDSLNVSSHWAYMDYCHMETFFADHPRMQQSAQSLCPNSKHEPSLPVLWLSSEGSTTRPHADACGVNLVIQMDGVKRWILAKDAEPTRVPFEETSIFARASSLPSDSLTTELGPGDALFIPFQWYHEVISLTPTLSINQWYVHHQDPVEQAKEQLCRMVVSSFGQRYQFPAHIEEQMDPADELESAQYALKSPTVTAGDICRAFSHPTVLSEVLRVLQER